MTISDSGINLIKSFEGLRLNAYLDSVNKPTIGYGTTRYPNGAPVKMGDVITEQRADELLHSDCRVFCVVVNDTFKAIQLMQYQFDSLVCLCYNIGSNAFKNSTVVKLINAGASNMDIQTAWLAWNKITKNGVKVVSPGLHMRRIKEFAHFSGLSA